MQRKRKTVTGGVAAPAGATGAGVGRSQRPVEPSAQKAEAVAQAVARRASGASKGVGNATAANASGKTENPFVAGRRKGTRAQAVAQFKEKFQGADPATRHNIVKKVMGKKYGGAPWQKQVYGKNFKPGEVGKLNNQVKDQRSRVKDIRTKERDLRSQVSSASDETKSAIEQRLSKLEQNESTVKTNLLGSKNSRDKLLGMRDKALQSIAAQAKSNPKQLANARKRFIRKKIKARPKGTSVA